MREWSVTALPPKPDNPESGNHISRLQIRLPIPRCWSADLSASSRYAVMSFGCGKDARGAAAGPSPSPILFRLPLHGRSLGGSPVDFPGLWCECNILTESARLPVSVIEHAGFSLPRVILASRSIPFRGLGHVPLRGRQTVSDYSIYVLFDEERVLSDCRTTINCADDEEAIRVAKQWVDLHDVELWQSNRFITRFTPLSEHITLTGFRA